MTWTWTPLLLGLAIVWGIFTVALIILLIYRSTLTMHEDEQLYLDDANSHMQQEQTELLVKVNRLTKPVWVFGAGSGVLWAGPRPSLTTASRPVCLRLSMSWVVKSLRVFSPPCLLSSLRRKRLTLT